MSTNPPLFPRIALIGIGLIGSSLARAARLHDLAGHISISTRSPETLETARKLGLGDSYTTDPLLAVEDADLVIICVPMGAYDAVAKAMAPGLKTGAIVTDVGSTKQSAIDDLRPHIPKGVHLVPGHPVAGTEHSGPDAGFAKLFENHWVILTPEPGTDENAIGRVRAMWQRCGSMIELMDPRHHDKVLAITSHLPQLIAYTIVSTATDLQDDLKNKVVQFSAGGFRDFTRIAASDPVMWRDIYMRNKDAVLDVLGRFSEDLTALQRAIRRGEADVLEEAFTRTREIRRGVIEARQDFIDIKKD
ncbi:MAG TPA: prephenate/arogenate dehydrogenase family protein [Rhodospirillales bacterium]|nr:prephenate/arogenate dehydrogenase family protein [Rhodospirillales bacterium]